MEKSKINQVAFFITAHGYGHATRACAVIAALQARLPALHVHIYTQAPSWIFSESLTGSYSLYHQQVDVGLVQLTPLNEDIPSTLKALVDFFPFEPGRVSALAEELKRLGCQAVVCDISPFGIAVAKEAGIPSILIENFTWDWIYTGYLNEEPGFAPFIDFIKEVNSQVDLHLQTDPVSEPQASVQMIALPASRRPLHTAETVRQSLGLSMRQPVILISMGGIKGRVVELHKLAREKDLVFVVPGGSTRMERWDSLILLPHHGQFYHPDLVHASDAIVSKAGYSTVAEAYYAGIPFGYVSRARFREAGVMANFISSQMSGIEIPEWSFDDGSWVDVAPDLLKIPRIQRPPQNGADQLAESILEFLK